MTRRTVVDRARIGLQWTLTRLGERLSTGHVEKLNACVNYIEVGRWMRAHHFQAAPRWDDREELYAAVAAPIANRQVLYLEFGVWQGASMRAWSQLLKNDASSLHGFDSFVGLPEAWDASRPKGTFSVDLALPRFDDPRIALHPGWFSDTLPSFVLPPHECLVLHLDADLYSSTAFVLRTLTAAIRSGTILIFDEFCDRMHELKAFAEFIAESRTQFACLGATRNLEQVAFRRL